MCYLSTTSLSQPLHQSSIAWLMDGRPDDHCCRLPTSIRQHVCRSRSVHTLIHVIIDTQSHLIIYSYSNIVDSWSLKIQMYLINYVIKHISNDPKCVSDNFQNNKKISMFIFLVCVPGKPKRWLVHIIYNTRHWISVVIGLELSTQTRIKYDSN